MNENETEFDDVEREYELALNSAMWCGDNDKAFELSTGLKEYRDMFKIG